MSVKIIIREYSLKPVPYMVSNFVEAYYYFHNKIYNTYIKYQIKIRCSITVHNIIISLYFYIIK